MPHSVDPSTSSARICSRCNAVLRPGALEGLCPACVLRSMLLDDEPSPEASMQFAGYDLYEKLGEGGMGIVYKAQKVGDGGPLVAIKLIRDGEMATDAARRRFMMEMKTIAELRHDHIVPILEIGSDYDEPYYTMEYMPGGNLAQNAGRYTNPCLAAALLAKVAWAVHAGHQRRILHRDIKPANILFDAQGEPRLSDFGTAKELGAPALTTTGQVMGTPAYMAPERATNYKRPDAAAGDVWSLGIVLYELLAGERPFLGRTPVQVLAQVVEGEAIPLGRRRSDLDSQIVHICRTAMQKDPAKRYPSAQLLAHDLETYVQNMSARD